MAIEAYADPPCNKSSARLEVRPNTRRPGPSRKPPSFCATPVLLSFGGRLLVRLLRHLEDILVHEAGHGGAKHAERVPVDVRSFVRHQRRAEVRVKLSATRSAGTPRGTPDECRLLSRSCSQKASSAWS